MPVKKSFTSHEEKSSPSKATNPTASSSNSSSNLHSHHTHTPHSHSETKSGQKTRITIKYDVGFNNSLHIRGKGANLNWDKGIALRNIKPDEWVWETEFPFNTCEFKILINDKQYEVGNNHLISCGANIQYTPRF